MAVGDITRDDGSPVIVGNKWLLTGTIEANTTLTAFALGGTKTYIHSVVFTGVDDSVAMHCLLNQDASATTTNGTIAAESNLAQTNTVRYEALMTI